MLDSKLSNSRRGGGPKTETGKQQSSKNARKASIFTKGYLEDEDIEYKQEMMSEMVDQWQAFDPSRRLILLTIEQAQLGLERMMKAEAQIIEGKMSSPAIATEFCKRAGIDLTLSVELPHWYFCYDARSQEEKQHAQYLHTVIDQAYELKANPTSYHLKNAEKLYPELNDYLRSKNKSAQSFIKVLVSQYQQKSVLDNLDKLIHEILSNNKQHIRWNMNASRFEAIIRGMRAEQLLAVMDLEKSTRYATSLQNRIIKGFTALAAIDHHEMMITKQLSNLDTELVTQDPSHAKADGAGADQVEKSMESEC